MSQETQTNKIYYEYLDVTYLAKAFSKLFHEQSLTPEYYINQIGKAHSTWDNFPTEEPVKEIRQFLPHCRYPQKMKMNIFYKAERASQHLVVTECLSYYMFTRIKDVHYQGDPIETVNIQWLTVTGHRNPVMLEEEQYLLKNQQPICILYLVTKSGQNLYLDLCATQVDINHYSDDDGKSGYPYLLLDKLELNQPYAPDNNLNVTITAIEEPVPVTSENFGNYLEMLVDQHDEEAEYLIEYHERMVDDFRKTINRKLKTLKNKLKKKQKKNQARNSIES